MDTISFKVESVIAKELDDRAAALTPASRHTLARQLVLETLSDADRHRVLNELADLKDQVQQLRQDLATAVTVLLVQAGQVKNPKDAEAWVRRALLGQ